MPDLAAFRSACYAAARSVGGSVAGFRLSEGATPNFHQGLVTHRGRTVAVVWVRSSSWLAVAEPRDIEFVGGGRESGPLRFRDDPELVTALAAATDFRVLTLAEVDRPFDPAAWPCLSPDDVTHRNPATVGEALFHYGD
ncbi:MAG TPA: hypothetical protein VES42_20610 [Pilimelia sp.]|nr:hypothetical protein [Pilimelia sp.]